MSIAYIGIGSNLGERQQNIDKALNKLRERKGIEVEQVSSMMETDPVGDISQPKFLNAACRLNTTLYPDELMNALKSIEKELGRDKDTQEQRLSQEEQLKLLQEGRLDIKSLNDKKNKAKREDASSKKWGPRPIDLDILLYDDVVLKGNNLTIPHPLMQERLFVLEPLSEIASELMHPVLQKTIKQLLEQRKGSNETDKDNQPDVQGFEKP
jgi:7,8-dihydro-6-hydroxymethylpterin-pyrophosphokinase